MATPKNPWIPTREYFALVESEGVDLQAAAEELLRSIRRDTRAVRIAGLRRQWDPPSGAESREWFLADMKWQELNRQLDDIPEPESEARSAIEGEITNLRKVIDTKYVWRERLPRDPQLRVVPNTFWRFVQDVGPDLTSSWIDDPERPRESLSVDWLPGTLTSFLGYEREVYEGLCVDRVQCHDLVKRILGKLDRRGAPRGPRNKDDLLVVEGILEAIRNGDGRDCGKIAWDFIPETVAKTRAGDLMQRRVCRRVKEQIQLSKNPAV